MDPAIAPGGKLMDESKSRPTPDISLHRDGNCSCSASTSARVGWRYYLAAGAVVLLVLVPLDIPIAQFTYRHPPLPLVLQFFEIITAVVGDGIGVFCLLMATVIIFRIKLSRVPLMLSASLGAGLLADIVKLCVFRMRPRAVDLSIATFNSTFHGWFPLLSAGSAGQSFPSGHATTATGLAFTLAMIYPRGRGLFTILAIIASVSRIIVHAHFPTDVVAGAILGTGCAYICHLGFAAPMFAWFERKFEKDSKPVAGSQRANAGGRTDPAESSLVSAVAFENESSRSQVA